MILIYDIEIKKAVPGNEPLIEGVDYCEGWDDKENMGVACCVAYHFGRERTYVFFDDNKDDFKQLTEEVKLLVGFNNRRFDNVVLSSEGWVDHTIAFKKTYDLLEEIWIGLGYDPDYFTAETHAGYGLASVCETNFNVSKTGYGGAAPIDYQSGAYGRLVDYNSNDVWLTTKLFKWVTEHGWIYSPKNPGEIIPVRRFFERR